MKLDSKFNIRDRVHVDGCTSGAAYAITAILWREGVVLYELSWFSGPYYSTFVEEWRLEKSDG